jgi:hypothetical protein
VEDEDVDTEIKNDHAENNRSLKKKTQKCSKYEHVMFVSQEYRTSYAKIVIRIEIFNVYPLTVFINNIKIHEVTESEIVTSVTSFWISFCTYHE